MQGRRKKDRTGTLGGGGDQIASSAKLLDITYECYGFSSDFIEINN